MSDFSAAVEALKELIKQHVGLDLPRPILTVPRLRSLLQGRGCDELRQNKRGDWIFSPTLRTLRAVFGQGYVVERVGKGIAARNDLTWLR